MHLEEQLRRRLDATREGIRAKYKSMQSAQRPNDPTRKYLSGEIEKELQGLRDSLSHDEIVQVQTRIDRIRPDAGPMGLLLSIAATQCFSQNFRMSTISCSVCSAKPGSPKRAFHSK